MHVRIALRVGTQRIIQIMLATMLCGPSAWATDTPALIKKPVAKKNGTVAQATKPIKTETQPAERPDKSIQSEQASNPIASNPTTVTASEKGVPVEVDSEDKVKSAADNAQPIVFKTMVIQQKVERDTRYTSPIMRITREQIELQNAQTVEEAVKFMPSLQIRQRFPGDPNGIMAIRGSDMFATGRNMVFVDGSPIHNFLQATFNGAPRWSLVGPNEVEAIDVVYGGFSAEYSGNSIGGVVNITTRMPQKREFYTESSIMIQPYNNPFGGDKQVLLGNREFASYGDRFKDRLSVLASYNRIENQSQPMTYLIDNTGLGSGTADNPVTGAYFIPDTRGTPSAIYGDSGVEKHHSSLYKIKLGLDITPTLLASFTSAYEVRTSTSSPQTYLTNASGQSFYTNGTLNASQDGSKFDVISKSFGLSENTRETLQLGGGVNGKVSADSKWTLNSNVSSFNVLRDDRGNAFYGIGQTGGAAAARVLNSGADGQLQAFNNYNWFNADAKLSTNELFNSKKLSLLYGYHYDQYNLGFQQSKMTNYAGGIGAIDATKTNTGQTSTHAGFGQAAYRFRPGWDVTAGVRYEDWSASNGVVGSTVVPDRNLTATSPKVSLGYESGNWKYRYSFGRAHRFPVIAELFQALSTPLSITQANANLKPENATQHNWSVDYVIPRGFIRTSVFRDEIEDAIQSVKTINSGVTTTGFQNIDKTSTTGVELIFQQSRVMKSKFDFSANGTWMNVQVDRHHNMVSYTDPTGVPGNFDLTGKQIIRLPHYRANYFLTYNATNVWDLSIAGRFISDSFTDQDNKDYKNNVYGAVSGYHFMDFKTNYRFKIKDTVNSRVSAGINNLTGEQAWIVHPYPQRMFFAEVAFSF
ncbi:MAG: TonB-dependent receptor [Nitrosospira sp.]|nr:TonB-dependent receptor [Nitrosospira sp.]